MQDAMPTNIDEQPQLPLTRRELELIETGARITEQPTSDEIEFLHATFAQVGLPRSRVDGRSYERRCGLVSIKIEAGELWDGRDWVPQLLPYGTKPRLINIYVTTYAVRHKTRIIPLGDSKRDALRLLGFRSSGGGRNGTMAGFDQQMRAFAAMRLKLGIGTAGIARTLDTKPVRDFQAWAVPDGAQRALWPSALELAPDYFDSMREFALPLDPRAIDALDSSALSLDLYAYLAHRLRRLNRDLLLPWPAVREQFGAQELNHKTFKRNLLESLRSVLTVYPEARVVPVAGGLWMKPSKPPVQKVAIVVPAAFTLPAVMPAPK